MSSPLQSLIATGTKLWLDSVDPDLVKTNRALGAAAALLSMPWCWLENVVWRRPALGMIFARKPT